MTNHSRKYELLVIELYFPFKTDVFCYFAKIAIRTIRQSFEMNNQDILANN
jgi:hypothetical protein